MKHVSKNRLITAWTSFLTTSMIFLLLGYFLGWEWWVFFVPALVFIEAVRASIAYMTGEHTRVCPNCLEKTPISNKFCDKCGHDLRTVTYQEYGKAGTPEPEIPAEAEKPTIITSKNYCPTCGGPLDGSEKFCPTCGMPEPGHR